MKILRICSLPSISKPGMGMAALRLAQTEGLKTTAISYSLADDEYTEEVKSLNLFLFPFDNPVMPQSRNNPVFYMLQVRRLLAILRFSFSVLWFIKFKKPDIIHLHSPMHFLIGAYARLRRIPTFVTFHGTDFNRIVNSRVYQLCVKPIKHINCVSSHQLAPLKSVFPNANVKLVSNAVDFDLFSSQGNNKSNRTLIAVGSLRWQKGFDKLIDTFAALANDCKNWNLKIIGDGADKAKLKLKIDGLGLNTRVELLGAISRSEVASELSKADIFVLSSITEGLPKVLLEAMRAKCGCIAFKVGDCERVLSGSGVVVDAGDYAGLRVEMLKLIMDPELRQSLGQRAFHRAGEFSWARYQDIHMRLYCDVLRANSSGQRPF